MANHKSAEKRARQAVRRNARNTATEGTVRTFEKRLHSVISGGDSTAAKSLLSEYTGKITQAAARGVLHAKTASRKISRLAIRINQMGAVATASADAAEKVAKRAAAKAAAASANKTSAAAAKGAPKAPKAAAKAGTKTAKSSARSTATK